MLRSGSQDAQPEAHMDMPEDSLTSRNPVSAPVDVDTVSPIYRYCSVLPQRQNRSHVPKVEWRYVHPKLSNFTLLLAMYGCMIHMIHRSEESLAGISQFQAVMTLPTCSPVAGPIVGPKMPSKRQAKAAVCLLVCRELQKHGQLDDNFVPKIASKKQSRRENNKQIESKEHKMLRTNGMVHNLINPALLVPTVSTGCASKLRVVLALRRDC